MDIIRNILTSATLALAMTLPAQEKISAPMNDTNGVIDNTIDSLNKARTARPVAGSSRKGDNPVLFLVGNSTMRTGTLGNGSNGQWGWGYYLPDYFDPEKNNGRKSCARRDEQPHILQETVERRARRNKGGRPGDNRVRT